MLKKAGVLCLSALMVILVLAAPPAGAERPDGRGPGQNAPEKITVCQERRDGTLEQRRVAAAVAGRGHFIGVGDRYPGAEGVVVGPDCMPVPIDVDGDGVPDTEDNCIATANPDQANTYGSAAGDACEDSNADGVADANEPHFCLSVDGAQIRSHGTATCTTEPGAAEPNTAMAHGAGARAIATAGSGNEATADGARARAIAQLGDNNRAVAIGWGAAAVAQVGDGNVASALHSHAGAFAGNGHRNTAIARSQCAAVASGSDDLTIECG